MPKAEKMKWLVTGASGFLGVNIVKEFASRGCDVVAGALQPPDTESVQFLRSCSDLVVWASIDVTNRDHFQQLLEENNIEAIMHCAAVTTISPDHARSIEHMMNTNYSGTVNILESARVSGVERVMFLSSAAVYGRQTYRKGTIGETDPLSGTNPYALSKIKAEQCCRLYTREHGMSVTTGRLGAVYGPMERPNIYLSRTSIPCQLVSMAMSTNVIKVSGMSVKQAYSFVNDVVRHLVDIACLPQFVSRTFNIGAPYRSSLNDLVAAVASIRPDLSFQVTDNDVSADIIMGPDDERSVLDCSCLEAVIGKLDWLGIEDGLSEVFKWFEKRQDHGYI